VSVVRYLSVLFLALGITGTSRAASVGMATHVLGKTEIRSAGGGAWKPLRLMQPLDAGTQVRCGAGAEAVVVLFENAARYKIGPGATATLGPHQVSGAVRDTALPGPAIRIAKAMGGSRLDAFIARPAQSHQRLTPQFPGWMAEGERHFDWAAMPGAATYSFTLFDPNDNVVWSARGTDPKAEYPVELPYFALRRPHVWRLVAFSPGGKPLPGARWGLVTFLSQQDIDQLTAEVHTLEALAQTESTESTGLVLLAELYRSYGVLEKALEVLESPQLASQPGIQEAQEEIYRQAGRCVQLFRPPSSNAADEANSAP
jgi:hypothetical protein